MSHDGHFGGHGFSGFHHEWHDRDWLRPNIAADASFMLAEVFQLEQALMGRMGQPGQPGRGAQQPTDAGAAARPAQVQVAQNNPNPLPNTQIG